MDDETKAAIDSLLGGKKTSSAIRYGGARVSERERAYSIAAERERLAALARERERFEHHAREIRERAARERDERIRTKTEAERSTIFSYHESERVINTREQIATLSVDTASASIVLKAHMTDEVINAIHNQIPLTSREWLPNVRAWRFAPSVVPILKPLLKRLYKDVQMLGVPKALPATKFDQLMARLDGEDKAKVYKLLAMKYHPDKGGDKEVMTLINLVFKGG